MRTQIVSRGIANERVLEAMRKLPRESFVPGAKDADPYGDHPVSIGYGQTISQPYIVAYMTSQLALRGEEKVLEIGTGSGYQTAILSQLCHSVCTVERIPYLLKRANRVLAQQGRTNIEYRIGDGSEGWLERAPFDGILVAAAVPRIPDALKGQLADNGRLVTPVGNYKTYQMLTIVERIGQRFETRQTIGCRFVPCIGKKGF